MLLRTILLAAGAVTACGLAAASASADLSGQPPAVATPPTQAAKVLRLCTLDAPFPPYTLPNGQGSMQRLVRHAAADMGWRVHNIQAPRARCLGYLQEGAVDALIASFLPERMAVGVFPMASATTPDLKRALGVPRFAFYRRTGTVVEWDGQALSGTEGRPVGVLFSFTQGAQLRAKGIAVDDTAKTNATNFDKLLLRRLSAVLAVETEGQALLADARFKGKVEPLAAPYVTSPLYLQVSRQFHARAPQAVEAIWAAVRRRNEAASSR